MPLSPWRRSGFSLKFQHDVLLDINDEEGGCRDVNLRSNPILGLVLTYKTGDVQTNPSPAAASSAYPPTTDGQSNFFGLSFAMAAVFVGLKASRCFASYIVYQADGRLPQSCASNLVDSVHFAWSYAGAWLSATPPPAYTAEDGDGVASTPPKALSYAQ